MNGLDDDVQPPFNVTRGIRVNVSFHLSLSNVQTSISSMTINDRDPNFKKVLVSNRKLDYLPFPIFFISGLASTSESTAWTVKKVASSFVSSSTTCLWF